MKTKKYSKLGNFKKFVAYRTKAQFRILKNIEIKKIKARDFFKDK
jgi:hypothetical protein